MVLNGFADNDIADFVNAKVLQTSRENSHFHIFFSCDDIIEPWLCDITNRKGNKNLLKMIFVVLAVSCSYSFCRCSILHFPT